MIGESQAFRAVERLIQKMAAHDVPVLIEGETGTGKDLAARAIHYRSARRERPFVPVNCGALPDSLIESELFGHRRGAFTDAREDQPGLVALAHSGTLFLDEVDALTPKAQVTLLRFLQDQQYRPIGGRREERADVRLIAATNRSLDELAQSNKFRADLLYRIRLMQLTLPPLRERKGDVKLLSRHFLDTGCSRFRCNPRPLAKETLAWFEQHTWPGNVRELEHVVYQGLLLSEGPAIAILAPQSLIAAGRATGKQGSYRDAKEQAIKAFEQMYLARLIEDARGNVSVAARIAGTERRHLGRLLKKHRLTKKFPHEVPEQTSG
jgi:two-component system, NtrC family, response regulator GlrR